MFRDPPGSLTHAVHCPKYQYFNYRYPLRGTIWTLTFLYVSVRFGGCLSPCILGSKVHIRFELCKSLIINIST